MIRMQRTVILAALAVVCLVAARSGATTYYVSTAGKDTNSGLSVTAPFKTITKAASVAAAGDVVHIRTGTYSESITTPRAGTTAAPIRFIADTTKSIFDKAGRATINGGPIPLTINKSYVQFSGFRLPGGAPCVMVQDAIGIVLTNCDIDKSKTGENITVANAVVQIVDSHIRRGKTHGLVAKAGSVVDTRGGTIRQNTQRGVLAESGSEVLLSRVALYSNKVNAIELANAEMEIINCLIYSNTGAGIRMETGASGVLIVRYSTIARNTTDGVLQKGGTSTIQSSIISHNRSRGLARDSGTMTNVRNCIALNSGGNYAGQAKGLGEIDADPQYTSTTSYILLPTSPCLNIGLDLAITTDFVSASRPQGGGYDLGCYEGAGGSIFTDVSSASGLSALRPVVAESDGGGLHFADLNSDGLQDIIISGAAGYAARNAGALTFVPASLGSMRGQGAILDVDNDGDADVVALGVGSGAEPRLFVNSEGVLALSPDGHFAAAAGAEGAGVVDVDRDGWPDVALFAPGGNYIASNARGSTPSFVLSRPSGLNHASMTGNGHYVSAADANDDGWPDFFYGFGPTKMLFSNAFGDWAVGSPVGVRWAAGTRWGSAWGDFDNDGEADLFVSQSENGENGCLFQNNHGTLVDVGDDIGLAEGSGQRGCAWGDYDNDGDLDLIIATRTQSTATGGTDLYENLGGTLTPTGRGNSIAGDTSDVAFADLDNDGDLDLVMTRLGGGVVVLRNDTNSNRYLLVRAIGCGSRGTPTLASGVRIELKSAAGVLLASRTLGAPRGMGGTEPLWTHFGGTAPGTSYIVSVHFASGVVNTTVTPGAVSSTIGARTISQMLTVSEPSQGPPIRVSRWREVAPDE